MCTYVVESMTTEERHGLRPFITIAADAPGDSTGNFTLPRFFLNPETALAVGHELIAHAKRCGATEPETNNE